MSRAVPRYETASLEAEQPLIGVQTLISGALPATSPKQIEMF